MKLASTKMLRKCFPNKNLTELNQVRCFAHVGLTSVEDSPVPSIFSCCQHSKKFQQKYFHDEGQPFTCDSKINLSIFAWRKISLAITWKGSFIMFEYVCSRQTSLEENFIVPRFDKILNFHFVKLRIIIKPTLLKKLSEDLDIYVNDVWEF